MSCESCEQTLCSNCGDLQSQLCECGECGRGLLWIEMPEEYEGVMKAWDSDADNDWEMNSLHEEDSDSTRSDSSYN